MTNNSLIVNNGRKILINRTYKTTPDYEEPTQFKVGISNGTPTVSDTSLDQPIPISNGTVLDDGDNQLTGSNGADNSTDNSTIYKEGANVNDDVAQNIIANDTNTTKTWTISDLSSLGTNADSSKYTGLWFYIKDATALAKFKSSGTCLEVKLGSDSSNYYSITFEVSNLSTGWNWIKSSNILSDWTETGTVSGDIDTFIIEVTTNNATDEFVAGDVVYDLLRQWQGSDFVKDFESAPTINETNIEAEYECVLTPIEANGFDLNALGIFNEDSTAKLHSEDVFTAESKSTVDRFKFVVKDRIID